jgi:nicotinate-nucleotide adenylyltransferase
MLRFRYREPLTTGKIGLLPGAFNPPTVAHAAVAREARGQHGLDQVVFLLPEVFPHKGYEGATFEDRLAMLGAVVEGKEGFAVASSDKGLFVDIARQARETCGPQVEIYLICGLDAAERVWGWDYGEGRSFAGQLEEFQLLVASRGSEYTVPAAYEGRIHGINLPDSLETISSTSVREAVAAGKPFRAWVDEQVADRIERQGLYRGSSNGR